MNAEVAKMLKTAADRLDIEVEVTTDYSGRGMYGKSTAGLVLDNPMDLVAIAVEAANHLNDMDKATEADDLVGYFYVSLKWDNMGRSYIVY